MQDHRSKEHKGNGGNAPRVRGPRSRDLRSRQLDSLVHVAVLAGLTIVGGFIRIPISVVPFTFQTFFVYLSGDLLGKKKGALSQLVFLGIGLAGFPVFSSGGGLGYVLQPSFGYLVGFPLGAYVCGAIAQRQGCRRPLIRFFAANIVGMVVVLAIGALVLYGHFSIVENQSVSLAYTLWIGVAVFLPGECLKAVLAAWTAVRVLPVLNRG